MTIKKLFPLFIAFFAIALFTACEKEDMDEMEYNNESTTAQSQQSFFDLSNQSNATSNLDSNDVDCFTINFPITVIFPDQTTTSINDEESLEQLIDDWYDQNPNSDEDPTLEFPITVTLEDGTEQTINDEDTLCDLFEECYGDDDDDDPYGDDDDNYGDDDDEDCDFEEFEDCFDINFPITLIFPDGTTADVSDEDALEDSIDDWYDANPNSDEDPTLEFPVTVTLEDSSQQTINNQEELEALFLTCIGDEFNDEDCFSFVFPITFSLPDGTTHTVNSDEEAEEIIIAFYEQNPDWDDDDLELQYPITVELEDSTTVTISDEDELEELEEECDD